MDNANNQQSLKGDNFRRSTCKTVSQSEMKSGSGFKHYKMAATVNGVTLAALFYHHQSSPNNAEGFLFGKVVKKVEDTISDTQITNTQLQTTIYITDFQPWSKDISIYGTSGNIDGGILDTVLQGRQSEVIGWYGWRRNTTMRISMKEAKIHQNMLSSLSPENPENFLFLMSTSFVTMNLSTHSFDHTFYRLKNCKFDRVQVTVLNLGDTTHTQYKKQQSINERSTTLLNTFTSFQNRFQSSCGEMIEVKNIQELSNSLQKQLVSISNIVTESEQDLSSLEKEVRELQLKVQNEEAKLNKTEELDTNNGCLGDLVETEVIKQSNETQSMDLTSIPKPISMDITSNTYSIKLDNQVLDLDRPSSSTKSSFDDSWLDISINPITSTGITTQTTVIKTASQYPVPSVTSSTTLKPVPLTTSSTVQKSVSATSKPNRTQTAKEKTTNNTETSNDNKDPFSFVNSMLGKDATKTEYVSTQCLIKTPKITEDVTTSRRVKTPKTSANQRDTVNKADRSVSPGNKVKVEGRTGSLERKTRQQNRSQKSSSEPKGQKSSSEPKLDPQIEVKIERARTQRAKARNSQPHQRRSLSREDKNESVPKDQINKGKLKSASEGKSDLSKDQKNKETKLQSQSDSNSNISDKKEDVYILPTADEDGLPSSSPVF